jgi:hypothetical protein
LVNHQNNKKGLDKKIVENKGYYEKLLDVHSEHISLAEEQIQKVLSKIKKKGFAENFSKSSLFL